MFDQKQRVIGLASFPVLPTPAIVSLFLHGCETKAGVGRTGNEARLGPDQTSSVCLHACGQL